MADDIFNGCGFELELKDRRLEKFSVEAEQDMPKRAKKKPKEVAVQAGDDTAETLVAIANDGFTVAEGIDSTPSVLPLRLVRSGDLSQSSFMEVELFSGGDFPAQSSDLTDGFVSRLVNFLPGEETKTIDIAISPEIAVEGDETFGVRLATSGSATVSGEAVFFTILDNVVEASVVLDPVFNVLEGTAEDDTLLGTDDRDEISGGRGDDLIVGGLEDDRLIGGDGRDLFAMGRGSGTDTIVDFGGVGTGFELAPVDTVDRLEFFGEGFTAENLFLIQEGADLQISFEGIDDSRVILQDFDLELLDNMPFDDMGNILFDGQEEIEDSFDVIAAESNQSEIFNKNTVTFLNDLDNIVLGFEDSDDVINAQGGDDELFGLSGNDLLRGGAGDDKLLGGSGEDRFSFSTTRTFAQSDVGIDLILDFVSGEDKIVLSRSTFVGLAEISADSLGESEFAVADSDAEAATSDAFIVYSLGSDSLFYNQNGDGCGFGSGGQFAVFSDLSVALSETDFQVVA